MWRLGMLPLCLLLAAGVAWAGRVSAAEPSGNDPAPELVQAGPLGVSWRAPATCPSAREVLARVEELLDQPLASLAQEALLIKVVIHEESATRFRLVLDLVRADTRWQRTLSGTSCRQATDASAVMIALAIDPTALSLHPPDAEDADPARARASTPASIAPAPPASARISAPLAAPSPRASDSLPQKPRAAWPLDVGALLLASVDHGTLPGWSVGPELEILGRRAAWEFGLSGRWLPRKRVPLSDAPAEGGRIGLYALAARVCWVRELEHWLLAGCSLFEAGRLVGRGFGSAQDASGDSLWWAPGLGPSAARRFGTSFRVRGRAELLFPLQRPEFFIENKGLVHTPAALVVRLSAGLEFDLR